jgi:hypothetical protein
VQLASPAISIESPAIIGPHPIHLEQITEARQRGKPILRAMTIASISGWSLAIFSSFTLLSGLFDRSALLLGAGLALAAFFELRGARELRRLNPRAPARLAKNQLFLAAIIVSYAGYQPLTAFWGRGPLASDDPQVSQMLGSFDGLARALSASFYGVVALVGLIGCGFTASYYASRRKHLEQFIKGTPAWIIDLRRKGISV